MKVERREGGVERRLIIGMITCDSFLARIAPRWEKEGMLRSVWANLVSQWCIDYHQKHKKAPGKNIQGIYEIWAEDNTDKDSVEGIGTLLSSISSEYAKLKKEANPDYLADMAAQHFDRVNAERRLEKAQQWLDAGHTDRAIEAMNGTKKIQLGSTQWIDPYGDTEAMRRAFERKSDPLIRLQGPIGEFFGDSLERDGFVAIQGQSKRKKSWALQELGHQALLQGRKVAMFQVGDLSEAQIMMRLMVRAAKRPRREGKARIPTVMRKLRDGIHVEHREVEWPKPLTLDRAQKAMSKIKGKEEMPGYRLEVHPNTSISVAGIMERMAEWDTEGWSADVVCLAEGSLVLTDNGLIPIEAVTKDDRLWDGVNWISHNGPICKGVKDVIEYGGVTATPDHLFWSEGQWRTLESCRRLGLPLAQTGVGRYGIRLGEDRIAPGTGQARTVEGRQSDEAGVRLGSLQEVREREVVPVVQSEERHRTGMPDLLAAQAVPHVVLRKTSGSEGQVSTPRTSCLEALRREGDRVPVQGRDYGLPLDHGESGIAVEGNGIGQDRERRALRTGEHPLVYEEAEHLAHAEERRYPQDAQVPHLVPGNRVLRLHAAVPVREGEVVPGADHRQVEQHPQEVRKARVWDILNAGPLHRFTVQGVLAHNCIDYADILAPVISREDKRDSINTTWQWLRRLSQERHCLVLTATQADAASFDTDLQTRRNFSNDRRKLDHVTAMYALNMTDKELGEQRMRINCLELREGEFTETRVVHAAGCLAIANPWVVSCHG